MLYNHVLMTELVYYLQTEHLAIYLKDNLDVTLEKDLVASFQSNPKN